MPRSSYLVETDVDGEDDQAALAVQELLNEALKEMVKNENIFGFNVSLQGQRGARGTDEGAPSWWTTFECAKCATKKEFLVGPVIGHPGAEGWPSTGKEPGVCYHDWKQVPGAPERMDMTTVALREARLWEQIEELKGKLKGANARLYGGKKKR